MSVATATKETIKETLAVCKSVISADDLFQSCAYDNIPIGYHQAEGLEALSRKVIEAGGFYIMLAKAEDKGYTFNFFDVSGELTDVVNINMPEISKDRKIPKLNWLKSAFVQTLNYPEDHIEIKYMHRIIDNHIRNGGTWQLTLNDDTIIITLKMNGLIKGHYEFHNEVFLGQQ